MTLGKLTVSRMILLICASFLIPIALSTSLLLRTLSREIRHAELERAGVAQQSVLADILVGLAEYSHRARTGDSVDQPRANVSASFAALAGAQEQSAEKLATTPEALGAVDLGAIAPAALEAQFRSLDRDLPSLAGFERETRLRDLLLGVRGLIEYLGDSSMLVQDPDLDSRYLMELTTATIPQSILHIDAALTVAARTSPGASLADKDREEVTSLGLVISQGDLDRVSLQATKALRANANGGNPSEALQRDLPPALDSHGLALIDAKQSTVQLAFTADAGAYAPEFSQSVLGSLAQSHALWHTAAAGLDDLLATRVAGLSRGRALTLLVVIASLALTALLATRIALNITRPLAQAVMVAGSLAGEEAAASGSDASQAGTSEILRATHALGRLAGSLKDLVGRVKGTVENLGNSVEALAPVAEQIEQSSSQLGESFREMDDASEAAARSLATAASAATQASRGIDELAAGASRVSSDMEAARGNVESVNEAIRSVSTAVEELSMSLSDVARSSNHSAGIANGAARNARETTAAFDKLRVAAEEIGNVVGVISDIADQTNLLALNARIEAASAGEAGRGFTVVANEVKELARQTALATQEIEERIHSIQSSTRAAVDATEAIVRMIDEIHENTRSIVIAVEEQTSTSSEISSNLSEAVNRTDAISRAVASAAQASAQSAAGAVELSSLASRMSTSVADASRSANAVRAVGSRVDGAAKENREVSKVALGAAQRVVEELESLRALLREFS